MTALLIRGKDLNEVSGELKVSRETARTHLKHIFDKTGARRQADLVRLILRGPAGLATGQNAVLMKSHPFG